MGMANRRVEDTQDETLGSLVIADRSIAGGAGGRGAGADDGAALEYGVRERRREGGAGRGDGAARGHEPGFERAGRYGPEQRSDGEGRCGSEAIGYSGHGPADELREPVARL